MRKGFFILLIIIFAIGCSSTKSDGTKVSPDQYRIDELMVGLNEQRTISKWEKAQIIDEYGQRTNNYMPIYETDGTSNDNVTAVTGYYTIKAYQYYASIRLDELWGDFNLHPVHLLNYTDVHITDDNGNTTDFINVYFEGNRIRLNENQTYQLYSLLSCNDKLKVMIDTSDKGEVYKPIFGVDGIYGFVIESAGFINMYKDIYNPTI